MSNIINKSMVLLAIFFISVPVYSQQIIVNDSISIDTISQEKLRSIFSMRVKSWDDGTPVKVFVLELHSKLHRKFCLTKLEVFPYQLQRIWDARLFSGTGMIPVEVKDEKQMLKLIATTRGSIGYISEDTEVPLDVKVLQLQENL